MRLRVIVSVHWAALCLRGLLGSEIKKVSNRDSEGYRESLNRLKGRGIQTAFEEAQEIHGYVEKFGKMLLRHLPLFADRAQFLAE